MNFTSSFRNLSNASRKSRCRASIHDRQLTPRPLIAFNRIIFKPYFVTRLTVDVRPSDPLRRLTPAYECLSRQMRIALTTFAFELNRNKSGNFLSFSDDILPSPNSCEVPVIHRAILALLDNVKKFEALSCHFHWSHLAHQCHSMR